MRFCVLGPLEAREGGEELELGPGRQRALLALLLLHANEVISTDRLVEELWGEQAPPTATKVVQGYVSQLRRVLPPETIATRGSGYVLQSPETDVSEFERLLDRARGEAPHDAATTLRAALDLWRGRPFADFEYETWAQAEIARLEDLRLVALEERIEAELQLGDAARLVPELEALVTGQPLRERLRAQLMLALYRAGRQAEALDAYADARRRLVEELGIEPGPELQDLQRRILAQDPELGPVTRPRPFAAVAGRARWLIAAGVVLLMIAAAAAVAIVLTGEGRKVSVLPSSVVALDPTANRPTAAIQVGSTPSAVAVGDGSVWVVNVADGTISQIEAGRRRLLHTFATASAPTDVAASAGSLWVGNAPVTLGMPGAGFPGSVSRFDSGTRIRTRTISLPHRGIGPATRFTGQTGVLVAGGSLWAIATDLHVVQLDPRSGRVIRTLPLLATSLAYGDGQLWALDGSVNGVARIDPATGRIVQRIAIGSLTTLQALAVGGGSVWVTSPFQESVWRIVPGPPPILRTIPASYGVGPIVFGYGSVWIANDLDDTVTRIDPRANRATATIPIPSPHALAVGAGSVWVASSATRGRSGPLEIASCGKPLYEGPGRPGVLIASDLPLRGAEAIFASSIERAIEHVLRRHGFRAGRVTVGYQSCDDSSPQAGGWDLTKCFANARAYAVDRSVIGVIGTVDSSCAGAEIAVVNRAPTGPVPMVSPLNTAPGLTRREVGAPPDRLAQQYASGVRNYLRVIGADHIQVTADAVLAGQLGIRRLAVVYDRNGITNQTENAWMTHALAALKGPRPVPLLWNPDKPDAASVVARMRTVGADGVFLTSAIFPPASVVLVRALRRAFGPRYPIIATDSIAPWPQFLDAVGPAAEGVYVSAAGLWTPDSLPAAGRALVRSSGMPWAASLGAQAAEVLLGAIARSDGTRRSVVRQLFNTRIRGGYAGDLAFDRAGDPVTAPVTIFRLQRGARNDTGSRYYQDAVVDRVITPPKAAIPPP